MLDILDAREAGDTHCGTGHLSPNMPVSPMVPEDSVILFSGPCVSCGLCALETAGTMELHDSKGL